MAHTQYPALNERPIKSTLVLFDVDGTLTPARKVRCQWELADSVECISSNA